MHLYAWFSGSRLANSNCYKSLANWHTKADRKDLPVTAGAGAAVAAGGTVAPAGRPAGCDAEPHQ